MVYQVDTNERGTERLSHPAGEYKAAFGPSLFFGRDSIREFIDRMGLVESETLIGGERRKVFHNDNVAISFTKDPWQDYPRDRNGNKLKEPVYRKEWGNRPLKPARSGVIRIVGDHSEVMTAYNLINWRTRTQRESLGNWGYYG